MRHAAVLDALAIVAPVQCSGCGAHDRALCALCAAALSAPPRRFALTGGLPVWAGPDYRGPVRSVLLAFKDAGRTDAAGALAGALTASIAAALTGYAGTVHLATIPSTRAAFRARGYRPVPLLLRRARLRDERVLVAMRQTADQAGLGAAERAENRANSLRARPAARGRAWLLVDDILTTGATLDEAARALRAAGGTVLGAAVIARTPRLLGPV